MHEESGQWALQQAGLTAKFKDLVIPGGQVIHILQDFAESDHTSSGPLLVSEPGRPASQATTSYVLL